MPKYRNPELEIRDREIYRLYSKEKWSLTRLAEKYCMTISSIRNICTMQRLNEEENENGKR